MRVSLKWPQLFKIANPAKAKAISGGTHPDAKVHPMIFLSQWDVKKSAQRFQA